jgi:hypothetical protein
MRRRSTRTSEPGTLRVFQTCTRYGSSSRAPNAAPAASGLGLMRRGALCESMWLGSQAFYEAKAFNQNIGAWNTARIANMASVCSHCRRLHGWRTGRCLDVCVPRCCLWHSLLFRALPLASALPHRSASQCGTKRPWRMHLPCSDSLILCAWLACAVRHASVLLHRSAPARPVDPACTALTVGLRLMRRGLFESALLGALVTAQSLAPGCARRTAAVAPHLDRRAPAHCSARSLVPLDAACTVQWTDPSGLGADAARALCERAARPAGVLPGDGVQREHRSMEHCENDDDELSMRPWPSLAFAKCEHHACFRASLISRVFNANIGAWNTASNANMANACPLCPCLWLRNACFMLAFALHSFLEYYCVHY